VHHPLPRRHAGFPSSVAGQCCAAHSSYLDTRPPTHNGTDHDNAPAHPGNHGTGYKYTPANHRSPLPRPSGISPSNGYKYHG